MMDFTNFAAVELYHAAEAERKLERDQRKWQRAWRELQRSDIRHAVLTLPGDVAALVESKDRNGVSGY